MELRVLKYFLMVAREENITKAAELLHVTQPTLSRQLMQLEDELGVTLFDRNRHSISLTDDGMLLRRRAQEMILLEEKINQDFLVNEELSGKIVLGCGETTGMKEIAKLFSQYSKENPLVKISIQTANSDAIKEKLDKGIYDIGLLLEPVDISKYDFQRLNEPESWGILVRNDCALAQKDYVTPNDLLGYPLMVSDREMVINEISHWFGDIYNDLNIVGYYNLGYNLYHFISKKVGIALCLESMNQMEGIKFIPLKPTLTTNSVIVWKKNQIQSSLINDFIKYMKKCL